MMQRRVLALVGATATGKTDLGEALAARLSGEIVCADSRQVFEELEIGTGRPTPAQRAERPHHLFGALHVAQRASAGWYARAAAEVCEAIFARGARPILVGGSGLYVRALQHGLSGQPPQDPAVRARLEAEAAGNGREALHARLEALDPPTAARLAPRDARRVIRALEVVEVSGRPLSWWHALPADPPLAAEWQVVEITAEPRVLAERIARRTRAMFDGGLIEETRALVERGLEEPLRRLAAVGYDEALDLLAGTLTRDQAEQRTTLRTGQLAKRQRTWFRHQIEATRLDHTRGDTRAALARLLAIADGARADTHERRRDARD
jgi:tRNA dimethylallyltransferase